MDHRYVWDEIGKLEELIRAATDGGIGSCRCEINRAIYGVIVIGCCWQACCKPENVLGARCFSDSPRCTLVDQSNGGTTTWRAYPRIGFFLHKSHLSTTAVSVGQGSLALTLITFKRRFLSHPHSSFFLHSLTLVRPSRHGARLRRSCPLHRLRACCDSDCDAMSAEMDGTEKSSLLPSIPPGRYVKMLYSSRTYVRYYP